MRLQSVRVRNFKAIVDTGVVRLGPLTVFIGDNGAGKSSLIEALETWQAIVRDGLDAAMQRWFGIEHARHKGQERRAQSGKTPDPMTFEIALGASPRKPIRLRMDIASDPASNEMFMAAESVRWPDGTVLDRDSTGADQSYGRDRSMLSLPLADVRPLADAVLAWQFLTLSPERMGLPVPQQRTRGGVRLARDGANIADFLLDLRRQDPDAFDGIIHTLGHILPYARDLQPALTSLIERKTWLQLTEADFKVPGWMLSTGTLRLLALLALLRHPRPPPLILVEEIENGLDPRSMHLLVEEIRNAVLDGSTQVVLTTHSPYLLDLLILDHLVLVERDATGHPRFRRPGDDAALAHWAESFAPGRLYTMGNMRSRAE